MASTCDLCGYRNSEASSGFLILSGCERLKFTCLLHIWLFYFINFSNVLRLMTFVKVMVPKCVF